MERPIKPEIPHPSSKTVAASVRMDSFQRIFSLSMSHAATSGVTFHRTAPVVPASAFERSKPGDWLMVKSCNPMATSIENAVLSMKPRLSEGISCEKTRKVSLVPVSRITWYQGSKGGHLLPHPRYALLGLW